MPYVYSRGSALANMHLEKKRGSVQGKRAYVHRTRVHACRTQQHLRAYHQHDVTHRIFSAIQVDRSAALRLTPFLFTSFVSCQAVSLSGCISVVVFHAENVERIMSTRKRKQLKVSHTQLIFRDASPVMSRPACSYTSRSDRSQTRGVAVWEAAETRKTVPTHFVCLPTRKKHVTSEARLHVDICRDRHAKWKKSSMLELETSSGSNAL